MRSLHAWLCEHGVTGVHGIDTRALTKHIRAQGSMRARLTIDADSPSALPFVDINAMNLVAAVSRPQAVTYLPKDGTAKPPHIVAIDCGLKNNQIRCMVRRGARVTVVPHDFIVSSMSRFTDSWL